MMKLLKTDRGVLLIVYVKPDSRDFKIEAEDDEFLVYCRESPMKGRANKELVKELSRVFKRRIEIVSGFASKQKKVLIPDIDLDEVADVISNLRQESSSALNGTQAR